MEKQLKVTEFSIPVPWGIIAGKAWGEETDFPVLCIHGIFDNCDVFSRLIPLLPRSLYYVCIEFPGHGKSTPFPSGFVLSLLEHVYALIRVVDYFKWNKLYYLAHSVGSIPGLVLTSLLPERVVKVVLIDMYGVMIIDPMQELMESFGKLLEMEKRLNNSKQPSYSLDEAVERVMNSRNTTITADNVKRFIERSLVETKPGRYLFAYDQRVKIPPHALSKEQIIAVVQGISCPVLILQATETKIKMETYLSESEFYLDIFREKKNVIIENVEGDHDIHITHPDRLVQKINVFLMSNKSNL